jgi:hypothetical protein
VLDPLAVVVPGNVGALLAVLALPCPPNVRES